MTQRTAVVLGATGLVGRALVDRLAWGGHAERIVTLTRRPAPHPSPKVANHVIDFEVMEEAAPLISGDWLFSALGTTRKQAGSIAAQRRVDVDYQLAAARLAAANNVPHYLLVSSAFADADSRNAYVRMKGELEQAVLGLGFERVSIFQPWVLVGARDRHRPLERAGAAAFRWISRLPALSAFRPITGDEVASKMIRVSARPGKAREWFRLDDMFGE